MTKLTTHVLDVYSGKPGKGIKVDLYYVENNKKEKLNSVILNNDGKTDKALIEPFLDDVIIKFGISNATQHYHVPLIVSPWSYSTYRGS